MVWGGWSISSKKVGEDRIIDCLVNRFTPFNLVLILLPPNPPPS